MKSTVPSPSRKRVLAWLLCMVMSAPVTANTLQQITTTQQGQAVTLALRFSQPLALDSIGHFATLDPPRLVFDFPATRNHSGVSRLAAPAPAPLLRRLAVADDGQRSRLQLDLAQPAIHALATREQWLEISLQPAAGHEGANGDINEINEISFERGAASQAHVTLVLPSPHTQVRLRQSNQQLVADVEGTALGAAVLRRQEVAGQDTPATHLSAMAHEGGTRLVIDARGQWRYQAIQTGRRLRIDLIPDAAPALHLHAGPRISLNFHDIEVRTALQMLADFSGTNLVAADNVSGRLSLRLHALPWQQVLELIVQSRGLGMRRQGEVIWVAPRDELLARERLEREQQRAIDDLAPLHAQAFQLNYQRADNLRTMLGAGSSGNGGGEGSAVGPARHGLLTARGRAMVDVRTNQLFVTDTLAALANVRRMVERIDVAARQVLIEAHIVEADDSFGRELGVKLGLLEHGRGVALGNTLDTVRQGSGQAETDADTAASAKPALSLPARSLAGNLPASFALTLFNAASQRFLNIELSALEADGRGRIVASPRVITADQKAALIEQGEEIPYQQSIGSGASSTAFKKANLKLEVTPQITPNGNVILDVDVNKDSRGASTPSGLAINTKHVRTQVQVEDGGTVVIGGIYTETEAEHEARVPLLGDIPLLGGLFRHRSRVREKTELMIFLTPRVVGGLADQGQFPPGGATRR